MNKYYRLKKCAKFYKLKWSYYPWEKTINHSKTTTKIAIKERITLIYFAAKTRDIGPRITLELQY
jgi:hypothetical protein